MKKRIYSGPAAKGLRYMLTKLPFSRYLVSLQFITPKNTTYLSIFPIYFHDNVGKHEVLIIGLLRGSFPLCILLQFYIVAFEWM